MRLSSLNELTMTPLDTLYAEIKEIDPSFTIVFNSKTGNTEGICQHNHVFEEESLSKLIIKVWLYYFNAEKEE